MSVAPHEPGKSATATSVTVTGPIASALTATWNAQNSFLAHESAMLLCVGGAGSVGLSFCVSRTAPTVTAASAVPLMASEAAMVPSHTSFMTRKHTGQT